MNHKIIYSHYDEGYLIPPMFTLTENEEILGCIQIASNDVIGNKFFQNDHRRVPSQTVSSVKAGVRRLVGKCNAKAMGLLVQHTSVSVALNSFLNEALSLWLESYVAVEINGQMLANEPLKIGAWDTGIIVGSIAWDLVQMRLSFVVSKFVLVLTLNIHDYGFGNVMIVTVAGDISAAYSDGRVESNLKATVQQGERNAPNLAKQLERELNGRIEQATRENVNRFLEWIKNGGGQIPHF